MAENLEGIEDYPAGQEVVMPSTNRSSPMDIGHFTGNLAPEGAVPRSLVKKASFLRNRSSL